MNFDKNLLSLRRFSEFAASTLKCMKLFGGVEWLMLNRSQVQQAPTKAVLNNTRKFFFNVF